MAYKYTHFIPQNIAPKDAGQIGVYNADGKRILTVPLGRLARPDKQPLYSFGVVSDIHLWKVESSWLGNSKFDNGLTFFENAGCVMCIVCGDLTQTGFYLKNDDNDATETPHIDEGQFAKYKEICDKHTIPIYELMGNHESYYNQTIANNFDRLKTYTGKGVLSYTVSGSETTEKNEQRAEVGDDLFVLLGQPTWNAVVSDEDFEWLKATLESNKNRRCFVFVHSYMEEDSGDPKGVRENSIFDMWGATKKAAFMNLLKSYPGVILFHGHSHMKFEHQKNYDSAKQLDAEQESYKAANYTEKNGFKSIHVPSLATPRDIVFDEGTQKYKSQDDRSASQGYIVDVYGDCIVLNGVDFINNNSVPWGNYRIETAL